MSATCGGGFGRTQSAACSCDLSRRQGSQFLSALFASFVSSDARSHCQAEDLAWRGRDKTGPSYAPLCPPARFDRRAIEQHNDHSRPIASRDRSSQVFKERTAAHRRRKSLTRPRTEENGLDARVGTAVLYTFVCKRPVARVKVDIWPPPRSVYAVECRPQKRGDTGHGESAQIQQFGWILRLSGLFVATSHLYEVYRSYSNLVNLLRSV